MFVLSPPVRSCIPLLRAAFGNTGGSEHSPGSSLFHPAGEKPDHWDTVLAVRRQRPTARTPILHPANEMPARDAPGADGCSDCCASAPLHHSRNCCNPPHSSRRNDTTPAADRSSQSHPQPSFGRLLHFAESGRLSLPYTCFRAQVIARKHNLCTLRAPCRALIVELPRGGLGQNPLDMEKEEDIQEYRDN
jgi:hypothetical protein